MKNAEFMELLNLYLDHEISAADAARLEIEVQTSPDRRRIYQEYCQMQKACKMLVADFHTEPAISADAPGKRVVPFQAAPPRSGGLLRTSYVIGALAAAAACVAFIFSPGRLGEGNGGAATTQDRVASSAPATPSPAFLISHVGPDSLRGSTAAGGLIQRPMLVNDPLLLGGATNMTAGFVASVTPANDELAWVRTLQLAPLPSRVMVEDLRFEAQSTGFHPEARALGVNQAPIEAPSEMAAFRFTK